VSFHPLVKCKSWSLLLRQTPEPLMCTTQSAAVYDAPTHILTLVVRMPVAEVGSLGFNPWVCHMGIWDFSWGSSQRNCTLAKSEDHPRTPLPISLWWLECVDDELSALAVKSLYLIAAKARTVFLILPIYRQGGTSHSEGLFAWGSKIYIQGSGCRFLTQQRSRLRQLWDPPPGCGRSTALSTIAAAAAPAGCLRPFDPAGCP
jgi:hypothetical protein